MNAIPELASDRVLLRGWLSTDAEALRRIYGDAETMRYIGDGTTMPPERAWHALAYLLGHWALRGYGMWAVTDRATGDLLGRVGFHHPEGWPGLELGWLLDRTRWGHGLATEAARLAASWMWDTHDVDELVHLIRPENIASVRVAQKLGASLDHTRTIDGVSVQVFVLNREASTSTS